MIPELDLLSIRIPSLKTTRRAPSPRTLPTAGGAAVTYLVSHVLHAGLIHRTGHVLHVGHS